MSKTERMIFLSVLCLLLGIFNKDILWILPLTRSNKSNAFHHCLEQDSKKDSVVILSQLRLISSKRLLRKMRMISEEEFGDVVKKVKDFFPTEI